jgi:hypothetical protein
VEARATRLPAQQEASEDIGAPSNDPRYVGISRPTHTDVTRRKIALWLVGIFGFTVFGSFVAWFIPPVIVAGKAIVVQELIQLLLPVESALLGSAMGFYFGSKS